MKTQVVKQQPNKKMVGGFLGPLLAAVAPALIQGVVGGLSGRGMKKKGKK